MSHVTRDVEPETFREALFDHGLLIRSSVDGVVGRSAIFEEVCQAVANAVSEVGRASSSTPPERVHFPPVIDREILRRTGYMENFPQLCGSVHAFTGKECDLEDLVDTVREDGDWSEHLNQTAVTLCPAACYPLYPTLEGQTIAGTRTFQLTTFVFRNEPSTDPARLQSFRQHEHVFVADERRVSAWRKEWIERGLELVRSWQLPARIETATDLFFGRGGRMMKKSQQEQALKHELLVPITSEEEPTAIASFNDHQSHYGRIFGIRVDPEGACAHTACVGFGLERVALALLRWHGFDPARWPEGVRRRLSA